MPVRSELHDFGMGDGPVMAHRHPNGGGWVADTAWVDHECFVGVNAVVYGQARVEGFVVISGYARVYGLARVRGNAKVMDEARISDNAVVEGEAVISDYAQIYCSAVVRERAAVGGRVNVLERACIAGNACISGSAIVGGNAFFAYGGVASGIHVGMPDSESNQNLSRRRSKSVVFPLDEKWENSKWVGGDDEELTFGKARKA